MYVFFHLLVGLILGLILNRIRKEKWLIPVCMFTSILPDLIDKPLAFIYTELNSGRTVSHTLLFLGVLTIITGIILYKNHKPLIWGIGLSVFLHQIADSMWNLPTTWFFPIYGRFLLDSGLGEGNWFWVLYRNEITSPVEWFCATMIILILARIILDRREPSQTMSTKDYIRLMEAKGFHFTEEQKAKTEMEEKT